jgi:hypothetical protein
MHFNSSTASVGATSYQFYYVTTLLAHFRKPRATFCSCSLQKVLPAHFCQISRFNPAVCSGILYSRLHGRFQIATFMHLTALPARRKCVLLHFYFTFGRLFFCGLLSCSDLHFFYFTPLYVTICPETFSNLCVNNVRDM